jgi:hypothetical protein
VPSKQPSNSFDHELDDISNKAKPDTPSPSNSSEKVSGPLDLPERYTIPVNIKDRTVFSDDS